MARRGHRSDEAYDPHLVAAELQAGLDAAFFTFSDLWRAYAHRGGTITTRQPEDAVFSEKPLSQLDYLPVSLALQSNIKNSVTNPTRPGWPHDYILPMPQ